MSGEEWDRRSQGRIVAAINSAGPVIDARQTVADAASRYAAEAVNAASGVIAREVLSAVLDGMDEAEAGLPAYGSPALGLAAGRAVVRDMLHRFDGRGMAE